MRKEERHKWIKKLVRDGKIGKQDELVMLLIKRGVPVTQATISRDVKELQLLKKYSDDGHQYYALPAAYTLERQRLERLVKTSYVSIEIMEKMISFVTVPGSGVAIGKLVEELYKEAIFVVLTNDDKLLIVARSEIQAKMIEKDIRSMT